MAKYSVTREKYSRYGNEGIVTSNFEADSDSEALVKVVMNCGYGWEDEAGNELGDPDFQMPEFEDIYEVIAMNNGDGCDFIMEIKNLDTGKVLFSDTPGTSWEEETDW